MAARALTSCTDTCRTGLRAVRKAQARVKQPCMPGVHLNTSNEEYMIQFRTVHASNIQLVVHHGNKPCLLTAREPSDESVISGEVCRSEVYRSEVCRSEVCRSEI